MEIRLDQIITKLMCKSCEGRPEQGAITGLQFVKGNFEIEEADFVCQRYKGHPGIDPDVIFTDRGGKLWIDRIPLDET